MKKILSILLSIAMVCSLLPISALAATDANGVHICENADDCLVCDVAEKINALPDVTAENAASAMEQLYAIDRIKFDLTDEEYDELLTLVDAEDYAPTRYFAAVEGVKQVMDDGASFYIQKSFLAENGTVSAADAAATFKLTNTAAGTSQVLTLATIPYQVNSFSSDPTFYSANAEGNGWRYRYFVPAGTYTLEELSDSGATVGGEAFVTTSTTASVNGGAARSGKTVTFTAVPGETANIAFNNSLGTYTVTFDANGGTGDMWPEDVNMYASYTLPECEYTAPDGKQFKCWYVTDTDTLEEYRDVYYYSGDTIEDLDAHLTLTAEWAELHTVTFDANGGTGTMEPLQVIHEEDFTLPACEFTAPDGKQFKCWSIDDVEYTENETYYYIESDLTVTAEWETVTPKYKITFMNVDAVWAEIEIDAGSMLGMAGMPVPAAPADYPEGSVFYRWYTEDGEWIHHGVYPDGDIIANATWKVPIKGTVTIEGTPYVGQTLTANANVTTDIGEESLQYQWFRGEGPNTPIAGANGMTYTATAADVGYKLTCLVNCINKVPGSIYGTTAEAVTEAPVTGSLSVSVTVTASDATAKLPFTVQLSDTSVTGTYGDMTFTDGAATLQLADGESASAENLPANTTYTITCTADPDQYLISAIGSMGTISAGNAAAAAFGVTQKYTVTFDANGHGTAPSAQTKLHGEKVTAPAAPEAEYYEFGGWYKNAACTDGNEWDFTADTVTGAVTLYAKWTEKSMGTVTATGYTGDYDAEEHSITVAAPDGAAVEYNTDGSDTYSAELPKFKNVGTYTVYYRAVKAGYPDVKGSAVVSIAPKAVTVTADAKSKVYGAADPALSYTASGLEGTDTLTGTLTRASGEDVGTYAIGQGSVTNANNPNYDITFVGADLTVTPADQQGFAIAEPTAEIIYGDSFTLTTTGGNGDGAVTWAVTAGSEYAEIDATGKVTVKGVGNVTVTATKAASTNYNATSDTYTFTSGKATPAVTAPTAKDLVYDGSSQPLVNAAVTNAGTVKYALGSDAVTAPADNAFATAIPEGITVGTYYVWYRVDGNENYSDVAAQCVTAEIARPAAKPYYPEGESPIIYVNPEEDPNYVPPTVPASPAAPSKPTEQKPADKPVEKPEEKPEEKPTEEPTAPEQEKPAPEPETPAENEGAGSASGEQDAEGGHGSGLWIMIGLAAIAAILILLLIFSRRKDDDEDEEE